MLNKATFTDQVNIRVTPELKEEIRILKGLGVDTSELIRLAILEAIDKAKRLLEAS